MKRGRKIDLQVVQDLKGQANKKCPKKPEFYTGNDLPSDAIACIE